jgi:hypothetical protein
VPDLDWDTAEGGAYRAALRLVNGLPLVDVQHLAHTTKDAALRNVCRWRLDTPGELATVMSAAGMVAMDESATQIVRRSLGEGWIPIEALAERAGVTVMQAQQAIHKLRPEITVESRRPEPKAPWEYRALPRVAA